MSEKKLLDAFGQIEEEFIEEAYPEKKKKAVRKRHRRGWMKWAAYAACAVLVMGIGAPLALDVYLGSVTKGVEDAEGESDNSKKPPDNIQNNGDKDIPGENQAGGSEATEGPWNPWVAHFNEIDDTTILDGARVYIPGYFTEELSEEEILALEPGMRWEWMQYSGHAGFDGDGNLVDVCLMVTTTIPENCIAITISEDSIGRCYSLPEDAVVSVCENVEYMVSQWDTGEDIELAADAVINGYYYTFALTATHQDIEQAKEDFTRTLECFAYYAEGKPELSAITAESIPEWFDKELTYKEALDDPDYGAYMLPAIPEGFTTESIRRYKDQDVDYLSGLWTKGYDELRWKVYTISESDENRLTSVDETKNYDLELYPIPRASSVPEELREIVNNPIFYADELTKDAVWARAYKTEDKGDSDGWRMKFSVRYDNTVVEVHGKGVDPEWVYQQLASLKTE